MSNFQELQTWLFLKKLYSTKKKEKKKEKEEIKKEKGDVVCT